MTVTYSDEAEADLDSIGIYTWTTWGQAQYVKYLATLRECCEAIVPRLKHLHEVEGFAGLFSFRCEHHVVYFTAGDTGVRIERILHERMLPSRHL